MWWKYWNNLLQIFGKTAVVTGEKENNFAIESVFQK